MFDELLKKLRELDKDGETVNEEFVNSLKTIFEAAVTEATDKALEGKVKELEEAQEQEINEFKEDTLQQMDDYLNYVVTEYMDENKVTIEEGLRGQLALETVEKLTAILSEAGINVDEDSKSAVTVAETKIAELTEEFNKAHTERLVAEKALCTERALRVFNEETQEMTDEQVVKAAKLCEDFDVDDAEEFRSKVKVIVETVVNAKPEEKPEDIVEEGLEDPKPEPHDDGGDDPNKNLDEGVNKVKGVMDNLTFG